MLLHFLSVGTVAYPLIGIFINLLVAPAIARTTYDAYCTRKTQRIAFVIASLLIVFGWPHYIVLTLRSMRR